MEITRFPNPILFTPCNVKVSEFDHLIHNILDEMWTTMKINNGMGLSANQVGLIFRLFVMDKEGVKIEAINPKILEKSPSMLQIPEACLSAPGESGFVTGNRSAWIRLEYQDRFGHLCNRIFTGIHAVCAQHEMDHLNGVSYMESENIPKDKRFELAKKWGIRVL